MEDMISRKALCEYALNQKDKSITPNDIMRFPSAQPETHEERTETHGVCLDVIDRQAVIDTVRKIILEFFSDEDGVMNDTEKTLLSVNKAVCNGVRELPSAQPTGTPLHDNGSDYSHGFADGYKNGLKDAHTIEPQQRWIPCSERLPEEEGWYITTIENEKTGRRRIENDLFAIGIAEAHGNTPYKFCKDGYRQKTIAWMPFPEPYAERRTDE